MSKYSFYNRINRFRKHYPIVNSRIAQMVAKHVWEKFDTYLFGSGEEIRFIPWDRFFSIEGNDNSTGIIFRKDKMSVTFYGMDIPIEPKHRFTEYEKEALDSKKHRVKYCRIVRIWHKRGWLYRLQLALEGTPPDKGRILGNSRVGVDIGTQTVAVVGKDNVALDELADKANTPERELRRINRAMDRSRRAMNPEFYSADGTIIPKNKLPKELLTYRGKRKWKESKRYKELASQRRYLYARIARLRKNQHLTLANKYIAYGDTFFVEKMKFSALAKKAKKQTEEEVKANHGKHKRRKRFGKSVANKAPAMFLTILKKKVESLGGSFSEIDTAKAKASQYNHVTKTYTKKPLSKRWNDDIGGYRVQRDLYSAFLIMNANSKLDGFDHRRCRGSFKKFIALHDAEIKRLTTIHTPSSMGISKAA